MSHILISLITFFFYIHNLYNYTITLPQPSKPITNNHQHSKLSLNKNNQSLFKLNKNKLYLFKLNKNKPSFKLSLFNLNKHYNIL